MCTCIILHTHLLPGDTIGIPQSHLKVVVVGTVYRVHCFNLKASVCLSVWAASLPVGGVITLLPGHQHEFLVVVVVVDESEVVVVQRGVDVDCACELKASE